MHSNDQSSFGHGYSSCAPNDAGAMIVIDVPAVYNAWRLYSFMKLAIMMDAVVSFTSGIGFYRISNFIAEWLNSSITPVG